MFSSWGARTPARSPSPDAGAHQPGGAYGVMPMSLPLSALSAAAVDQAGDVDGIVEVLSSPGFIRSDSMDIANDPRFFTGNVLDKRIAAFSSLSVVSGIMVSTALGECYSMKKNIDLSTADGTLQFVGFLLMNTVLFANVLATYVSVAQVYLIYRLMTAGPTGFEMASSFYLNPNIAFWRHAAVKNMLLSLPVFLLASSFRLLVKFDREMPDNVEHASSKVNGPLPPWEARYHHLSWIGLLVFFLWILMACLLFHVNSKHLTVFKERYSVAKDMERPLLSTVQMLSQRSQGRTPEV